MNPNSTNNFFGIKVSKPGVNVYNANSAKDLLYSNDYNSTIYYDETDARVIEGQLPDGSYGMWVSAPGQDVTQATGTIPGQLVFNSNNDTFQIVEKIVTQIPAFTVTYSSGSNSSFGYNSITVPHGQNTIPIVNIYTQGDLLNPSTSTLISSSYIPLPLLQSGQGIFGYQFPSSSGGYYGDVNIRFAVGPINIYVDAVYADSGNSAGIINSIPVTIFILQETAT